MEIYFQGEKISYDIHHLLDYSYGSVALHTGSNSQTSDNFLSFSLFVWANLTLLGHFVLNKKINMTKKEWHLKAGIVNNLWHLKKHNSILVGFIMLLK